MMRHGAPQMLNNALIVVSPFSNTFSSGTTSLPLSSNSSSSNSHSRSYSSTSLSWFRQQQGGGGGSTTAILGSRNGGTLSSPQSPILVGCALACAAAPIISVRNFSTSGPTTTATPLSEEGLEEWKIRAEVAENQLKELKTVLERRAMTGSSSRLNPHQPASVDDREPSLSGDEEGEKQKQKQKQQLKDKEIEDAFQSIASGAKKLFDEFTIRAEKSGCPAFNEEDGSAGRSESAWEKNASLSCRHSHCRKTGRCHYGCQARHNFHHHNRHQDWSKMKFDSKNFCKPVRHRRSLPTRLAMLGLGGVLVYCMGSLAMIVGFFMMLGSVVLPIALVVSLFFLYNHFYGGGSAGQFCWDEEKKEEKSTNTDSS